MKQIKNFGDLNRYGINTLTGEACLLSLRLLCDLNAKGKRIMEGFLGCKITSEPWNSSVNGSPSVASVLIAHDTLNALSIYCLFDEPTVVFVERDKNDSGIIGFEDIPEDIEYMNRYIRHSLGTGIDGVSELPPEEIEDMSVAMLTQYNATKEGMKLPAKPEYSKIGAKEWLNSNLQERYIYLNQFNASYNTKSWQYGRHPRYTRKLNHPGIGCNATHQMSGRTAGQDEGVDAT